MSAMLKYNYYGHYVMSSKFKEKTIVISYHSESNLVFFQTRVFLPVAEVGTQSAWAHHIVVSLEANSVQITSKKIIYHKNTVT